MKVTVNAEFGSEELKQYGVDLLMKGISRFVATDPTMFFNGLQQAMQLVMSQVQPHQRGQVRAAPHPMYGFGGPPMPSGYGPTPPMYGGPMPPGYGPPPPGYGPVGPDNVRPIREPAHVERCFPIEGTRNVEEGIGCCRCATYNGLQRVQCRNCGHVLCHHVHLGAPPIGTPPPRQSVDMTEQMIEQMKQLFQQITERPWPEPPEPAKPPQGA